LGVQGNLGKHGTLKNEKASRGANALPEVSMNVSAHRFLFLLLGIIAIPFFSNSLAAQCPGNGRVQPRMVELAPGKPFEAVRVQAWTWPGVPRADVAVEKILRDRDGRLRVERYDLGKRPAQPEMLRIGPEDFAGSESDNFDVPAGTAPQWISIDDPCSLKGYFLRPREGAATWVKMVPANLVALCSDTNPPTAKLIAISPVIADELFGHRVFAGVDVYGRLTVRYNSEESRKAGEDPIRSDERWCSADLGAMMGLIIREKTGNHTIKIVYKRVERKEPEASLFEVPSGYTLTQVVPDGAPVASEAADKKSN
jgi:hypothetical protein